MPVALDDDDAVSEADDVGDGVSLGHGTIRFAKRM